MFDLLTASYSGLRKATAKALLQNNVILENLHFRRLESVTRALKQMKVSHFYLPDHEKLLLLSEMTLRNILLFLLECGAVELTPDMFIK